MIRDLNLSMDTTLSSSSTNPITNSGLYNAIYGITISATQSGTGSITGTGTKKFIAKSTAITLATGTMIKILFTTDCYYGSNSTSAPSKSDSYYPLLSVNNGTNFYPIGFDAPSTDCAVEPIVYLPKDLIESIYSLCNGNQFVNVDFENFYANFNLQKSNVSLIVKNKEKQRVYFLLHELSETISEDVRTTWLDNILENLKLEKSSYGKKYKEVDSITQRQSVKDYANNLKNIIKEYKA